MENAVMTETTHDKVQDHAGAEHLALAYSDIDNTGATDSWAALQEALDNIGASGGGVLQLADGTYLLSQSLRFNYSNVSLIGGDRYGNTLKAMDNATLMSNAMLYIVSGVNNVEIASIGIDGNISNNGALAFGGVFGNGPNNGVIVRDCYIRNCIYDGVRLFAANVASNGTFTITGNRIENSGGGGIAIFNGQNGVIDGNHIYSCASNGIAVVGATDGSQGSNNVRITGNDINRSTPPTLIVGGGVESGFMIVFGSQETNIVVANNLCYDNRNAAQDGIGLGQDGVSTNFGCVVDSNVVWYAGLFGIDATNGSVVQNNVIYYSAQCGIKLGTDRGGPLRSCRVSNNLIVNPNESPSSPGQEGIWVQSAVAGSIYQDISIDNNTVVDDRVNQVTKYGLTIGFQNTTYIDCSFTNNNFRRVSVEGVAVDSTPPASAGWTWHGNQLKSRTPFSDFGILNGPTPSVFGYENFQSINASAVTVGNFIGGYEGMRFRVQHNDGNVTYKFSGANLLGNGGANVAVPGNGVWDFWLLGGTWYATKIN
jgi:hypothetical protein